MPFNFNWFSNYRLPTSVAQAIASSYIPGIDEYESEYNRSFFLQENMYKQGVRDALRNKSRSAVQVDTNTNWLSHAFSGQDVRIYVFITPTDDLNPEQLASLDRGKTTQAGTNSSTNWLMDMSDKVDKEGAKAIEDPIYQHCASSRLVNESDMTDEMLAQFVNSNGRSYVEEKSPSELVNTLADEEKTKREVWDALFSDEKMSVLANELSSSFLCLASANNITFSSFRAKPQARPIGHVNPKGYARGTRTIAGTLVTVTFDRDILYKLISSMDKDGVNQTYDYHNIDQLPQISFIITGNNEYGMGFFRILHGVEFLSEDASYGSNDLVLYQTLQFVALDATPIIPLEGYDLSDDPESMSVIRKFVGKMDSGYFNRITGNKEAAKAVKYEDVFTAKYASAFDVLYRRDI